MSQDPGILHQSWLRATASASRLRIATTVFALLYSLAVTVGFHWRGPDTVQALVVCIGLCLPWLVAGRRPGIALTVMLLAALVQIGADAGFTPGNLLLVAAVYELAARRERRVSVAGAVTTAGVAGIAGLVHGQDWSAILPVLGAWGGVLVAWLCGTNTALRWAYHRTLIAHTDQARREREHLARLAAAEERTRIARDLHDVVSHSLAGVLTLSEGLQRTAPHLDERTRLTLGHISASCRTSLDDFRSTLHLLRDQSIEASDGGGRACPIDALTDILDRVRAAGIDADLQVYGTARPLPACAHDAVVRFVQEATTNVFKHAGEGVERVTVTLDHRHDGLEVRVADDGGGDARPVDAEDSGYGLLGMRERFAALDGDLAVWTRPGEGFRVSGFLPRHRLLATDESSPIGTSVGRRVDVHAVTRAGERATA